ncbi:MAG: cupin domain-containing protein [candidate division Zixibacteria bacterium]|nr:cupin domain-containing protein [candidate division Zixibacteria bacterium]
MFVKNIQDIEKLQISGEGIKNVLKQVPIGPDQGWANTLRVFTLQKDGHTPKHSHDWEHVNYVISGSGTLEMNGKLNSLTKGSFAYVPPNVEHQYSNSGDEDFEMICIVPQKGDY